MKVIDREPSLWFLLSDEDDLILDVYCNHSAFGYSWTLILQDHECESYHKKGREALSQLALQIQTSAPILKESASPFKDRMVSKKLEKQIEETIRLWNANQSPEPDR